MSREAIQCPYGCGLRKEIARPRPTVKVATVVRGHWTMGKGERAAIAAASPTTTSLPLCH